MSKVIAPLMVTLLLGMVLTAGCQQSGQVVSTRPVIACPDCSDQLITSRIKGLDFERVVCPSCHKVWAPAASAYSDDTLVYYCPRCKEVVATCPECQKLALPPAVMLNQRLY